MKKEYSPKLEIIAEAAQGFEGNLEQAKLLAKAAATAGADIIKFQLVYADELSTEDYKIHSFFKKLEMNNDSWAELNSYCINLKINLCFEIFGQKSLNLAKLLQVKVVKIHGTDITNIDLLESLARSNIKDVLLGVGGAHWNEIKNAVSILSNKNLSLLLGFQDYPTRTEDNQIERLITYKSKVSKIHSKFKIGFADHTQEDSLQYALSVMSLGAGATVIEKHITLGKIMELEDFESALNPDQFKEYTKILRDSYTAFKGAIDKEDFGMSKSEYNYRLNIRRHVVSTKNLKIGDIISPKNVTLKRTSSKDFIQNLDNVYNKEVTKVIPVNTAIRKDQIK